MKPYIAVACSFLPPNATSRYLDKRILAFSKDVRNIKKTCVFSERMTLSCNRSLRGDGHLGMRVSSGLCYEARDVNRGLLFLTPLFLKSYSTDRTARVRFSAIGTLCSRHWVCNATNGFVRPYGQNVHFGRIFTVKTDVRQRSRQRYRYLAPMTSRSVFGS